MVVPMAFMHEQMQQRANQNQKIWPSAKQINSTASQDENGGQNNKADYNPFPFGSFLLGLMLVHILRYLFIG